MATLRIAGDEFACVDAKIGWRIIELGKRVDEATVNMEVFIAYHDFLLDVLLPGELDRFKTHMDTVGADIEEIEAAFKDLVEQYASRPTEKSTSSPAASPDTPAVSKVVDLSRVTPPASSESGRSQAS